MTTVLMYSTRICPYCTRAEFFLHKKGVRVEKILVDQNPEQLRLMIKRSGRRTVPQIFIGERHIGGYDDLVELDLEGELDPLLQNLPKE
ncbi:glutaredoxin 3 [Thioflexithrix psekupsensis]|uniref:Glutaredoxin n=1 Tax=Thioflexithrix psekupsensis TaxID=1570016 RepID=A0A251X3R1_9GAMM|nr:glutaredoxin 3 [Thioflexithrix psekupsensis]OUD12026.1 glutaredoxin 3 [Thioflexithrix psekupsensis]